jgi:hypothetical protein
MKRLVLIQASDEHRYSHEDFLNWRGIEKGNECDSCGGSGIRVYSSTATWKGGIGGRCALLIFVIHAGDLGIGLLERKVSL